MDTSTNEIRNLEAMARRLVPEFLGLPKTSQMMFDAKGEPVLYVNYTSATTHADGDIAVFIRASGILSDEVRAGFMAPSVLPNKKVSPSPLFEVHVQDDSLIGSRSKIAQEFVYFTRGKLLRNCVLCVHAGHPKLNGVFGEVADSAHQSDSRPISASTMMGGQ